MEKRLGKGLDALISSDTSKAKEKVEKIRLKDIVPNPFQPRKQFKEESMEDLVSSIKQKGVIQPVILRPVDGGYELVAGERRYRAAQELEMEEVPAIIKEFTDVDSLEVSLIENIQREELTPIEEATAFQQLVSRFDYTLDKVGRMMGKKKSTISNSLRLLTLEEELQQMLEDGKLNTGHAKVLLSINNPFKRKRFADSIIRNGLSVRQAEQLVTRTRSTETRKKRTTKDPEIVKIEEDLQHFLGTKVSLKKGKKRGRIEIQFYSQEDLQRLLNLLLAE
jgi:ParB family chromosome partitioning protein